MRPLSTTTALRPTSSSFQILRYSVLLHDKYTSLTWKARKKIRSVEPFLLHILIIGDALWNARAHRDAASPVFSAGRLLLLLLVSSPFLLLIISLLSWLFFVFTFFLPVSSSLLLWVANWTCERRWTPSTFSFLLVLFPSSGIKVIEVAPRWPCWHFWSCPALH